MRMLWKNCKGAVTVMVTLLLIPAVLITGTGVDMARIYVARSTLQDANQLASNSLLASYDALLQDLYGLFGLMQEDSDFADLVDQYIKAAIFTQERDNSMGTLNLFYGSTTASSSIITANGKNLSNPDVLRRQIEEYAKFRAPAIVSELLLEKLNTFEKVKEDAKVIKKKMEVDDKIEDLDEYYRKLYHEIVDLDKCRSAEEKILADVKLTAQAMQGHFSQMSSIKTEYGQEKAKYERARADSYSEDDAIRAAALATMAACEARMAELKSDYNNHILDIQDLSTIFIDIEFKDYEKELQDYQDQLEQLLKDSKKANEKKEELRQKINSLRESLDSGNCSSELVSGLTESSEGPSIMDQYEALLEYDLEKMAQDMFDVDQPQIEKTIYINIQNAKLGGFELKSLKTMNFSAYFSIEPEDSDFFNEVLNTRTDYSPDPGRDGTGFLLYSEISTDNSKFFRELETIYKDEDSHGTKKKNLTDAITKVFKKAQNVFSGLVFEPEGAETLANAVDASNASTGTDFGTKSDWGKENKGKDDLEGSLDDDFLSILANTAGRVGDKVILVVYDTEMFSDASTPGEDEGEDKGYPKENMAGIPLSTTVNYYFQSELEYLYNGNLADAQANLKSVAGMILLVRFVFNYVASFSISDVNNVVNAVKSALSWTGPFAVLAGELARLGLSIGESAMDVSRLIQGENVAIFKKGDEWKLSISGLINAAAEGIKDEAVNFAFDIETGSDESGDDGLTLSYTDYLRLFLLLVDGDELAVRTAKLIELNLTNYQDKIYADEEKMAGAIRFDLSKAITDFSITTTVDMRMLFLSMPFAQRGIGGVVPPRSMPISVTDYRGY